MSEAETIATPFAANNGEIAKVISDQLAVVAVSPPCAQWARSRISSTCVRSREFERQAAARNHHILAGQRQVPVPDIHPLNDGVAYRIAFVLLQLVNDGSLR